MPYVWILSPLVQSFEFWELMLVMEGRIYVIFSLCFFFLSMGPKFVFYSVTFFYSSKWPGLFFLKNYLNLGLGWSKACLASFLPSFLVVLS